MVSTILTLTVIILSIGCFILFRKVQEQKNALRFQKETIQHYTSLIKNHDSLSENRRRLVWILQRIFIQLSGDVLYGNMGLINIKDSNKKEILATELGLIGQTILTAEQNPEKILELAIKGKEIIINGQILNDQVKINNNR